MAACVAASSMTPVAVHCSCCAAHAAYTLNAPPHLGSFTRPWHWLTSLGVGAGSFGQAPLEEQSMALELEEHAEPMIAATTGHEKSATIALTRQAYPLFPVRLEHQGPPRD
jgi:hypothetical protein